VLHCVSAFDHPKFPFRTTGKKIGVMVLFETGSRMDWKTKFDREMELAAQARMRGNEGQARVCARRAAGAVAREYFSRLGLPVRSPSAMDLIRDLLALDGLPVPVRRAAENLTLRVSEDFDLPAGMDLLRDARSLAAGLLEPGSKL
jgi:hypothetical protein